MNSLFPRLPSLDPTIVLGIVGGIGSGKSFTTQEFVVRGASRFDADLEARKCYDDPFVASNLKERWSNVFDVDGKLDRSALAKIVFAPTPEGRQDLDYLNATIRPSLFQRFENWLEEERKNGKKLVVLDAPLLFEAGWESAVDYIVFVDASLATRRRRVLSRGWSSQELKRREACQLSLCDKKARADFIVDANKDDSNMGRQVEAILVQIDEQERRRHLRSL